jgi:hypothetical protein
VRLVQAGKLIPIEQALADLQASPRASAALAPRPMAAPAPLPQPARTGPSPFERDQARKAAEPQASGANALAAQPQTAPLTAGDPRERLHTYLHEKGQTHLADAVENASVTVTGGDLNVTAPKSYGLYFKDRAFEEAIREVFGRPLRLKFVAGEAGSGPAPSALAAPPSEAEDEVTGRALANPEVQRFREVFGGEVRKVRNLKD